MRDDARRRLHGAYDADGKANVGRDHYVRVCKMLRRSFPDVAISIEDLIVEGDRIVNRYIERGTLTGDAFLGIAPAGQRYEKPGTTVYRVAGDRLAESWAWRTRWAGSVSSASTPTDRTANALHVQTAPSTASRCQPFGGKGSLP